MLIICVYLQLIKCMVMKFNLKRIATICILGPLGLHAQNREIIDLRRNESMNNLESKEFFSQKFEKSSSIVLKLKKSPFEPIHDRFINFAELLNSNTTSLSKNGHEIEITSKVLSSINLNGILMNNVSVKRIVDKFEEVGSNGKTYYYNNLSFVLEPETGNQIVVCFVERQVDFLREHFILSKELKGSDLQQPSLIISPNPSKGKFIINYSLFNDGRYTMLIKDVNGKTVDLIFDNEALIKGDFSKEVAVNLASGMYFVELKSNLFPSIVKKLIIE